jgi:urea transporter
MITEGMTIMTTDAERSLSLNVGAARLPQWCFALASITAVIGVSLGFYMGLAQDHTMLPVHAHLNLLGWVSLFLMGLYYRTHEQALGKAASTQVALSAVGTIAMTSGMAGIFLGYREVFFYWALAGGIMVWTGFAIFAVIVMRTRSA